MKKVLLFLTVLIALFHSAAAKAEPRKLALLVGISDYEKKKPSPPAWWNLNCAPDIQAMKAVLTERFGFKADDILVLTDAKATRAGIVAAFENHLIKEAKPGDIVTFHYSGHGQQVKDDNGDELDGLDETLIPYDYISQSATDGAKTNLRDDQLGVLLSRLKAKMQGKDGKIFGNITLSFDCCFSGTATRGKPPIGRLRERGRGWNAALDGPRPAATRGEAGTDATLFTPDAPLAQGYVVLSATQSNQTAKEAEDERGTGMGAFTMFYTRALAKATPGATYRDIYQKIAIDLHGAVEDQDPQIEGDLDKKLFDDATLPAPHFLTVVSVKGSAIKLPAGSLQGISVGSKYAIYAPGYTSNGLGEKLAEATISAVSQTSSTANLEDGWQAKTKAQDILAARAIETAHQFGETRLKVWFSFAEGLDSIRKLDLLTTDGVTETNYDLFLSQTTGNYLLTRRDGVMLIKLPVNDGETAKKLQNALLAEWRFQYLRKLQNQDATAPIKIEVRVVPMDVKKDENGAVTAVLGDSKMPRPDSGVWQFTQDTNIMFELRNTSAFPVFVTVLDLDPAGNVNPIFPHPDAPGVQENRIPPDKAWHRITGPVERPFIFSLYGTPGTEILKVIATKEPADFSPLLSENAVAQRGENLLLSLDPTTLPLGRLLLNATKAAPRRGETSAPVAPASWNTAEAVFKVLP